MPTSAAELSSNDWRALGKAVPEATGALILYRQVHRAFFVYGFAKSQQASINDEEEAVFKKAAWYVLELTDEQLAALIRNRQFSEVDTDD